MNVIPVFVYFIKTTRFHKIKNMDKETSTIVVFAEPAGDAGV